MSIWELIALCVLFFATSVVGVVTGSNSLITVPAMFMFGVDARVAVATNMFGLTFMSVGGALPFLGRGTIDRERLPALVGLTLLGSAAGALLVLLVSSRAMPVVVSAAMLAVAVFSVFTRNAREVEPREPSRALTLAGYGVTLALGVYGGFYSGGYVTILTAAFVALFRMTFVEAVATTKIVNVFSSLVATLVFMWHGLVDYKLGMMLAAVMFVGAFVGARVALRLDERWLRRVFLSTVVALALKILLYDFLWKGLGR
ncbi:MAG TPA: sulfite exporter TauE/SafE family protein [Pyrinomonadaceae bacterium]|nr:sulfite exporter TauE/SafE family protein [Pyrinomonadaceae bacterium]